MAETESSSYYYTTALLGMAAALGHALLTHWGVVDVAAWAQKLLWRRYITVNVEEEDQDGASINELFSAVQLHLSHSAAFRTARNLDAAFPKGATALSLTLGAHDRLSDTFQGCQVWWVHKATERKHPPGLSLGRSRAPNLHRMDEKRSLCLVLHSKDKHLILPAYLDHILARAKSLTLRRKERLLYTNMKSHAYMIWGGRRSVWASLPFKHPATFDTLAIDPHLKKKIMEDLTNFSQGEAFYQRAGRAWKRGYLLYGPPGTGKSTLIAAMANFLQYDIYDLELTEVTSNAHLRNLLIKTSNKSIIVIEDIDCSLHLTDTTSRRKNERRPSPHEDGDDDDDEDDERPPWSKRSQVTLSGLLNFTDGLWSCCGDERIFVFTTNHIDKLDPALVRSGRMDMHIHLSYCTYEAFRLLSANYICVSEHELFERVQAAMADASVQITPAEVTEVLTRERTNPRAALECLLEELQMRKTKGTQLSELEDAT
ncbi:hypothetical protein L7F22_064773 [Adiantum nelumboides]|nr:hypothetical protein [Adiantum nelumboides]